MLSIPPKGYDTPHPRQPCTVGCHYVSPSADQLTYVVPISAAHLERSVPLKTLLVQISVANDVRKGEATFPDISAPAYVKL